MSGGHKTDILDGKYNKDSLVIGDTETDEETAEILECSFIALTSGLRSSNCFSYSLKADNLSDIIQTAGEKPKNDGV